MPIDGVADGEVGEERAGGVVGVQAGDVRVRGPVAVVGAVWAHAVSGGSRKGGWWGEKGGDVTAGEEGRVHPFGVAGERFGEADSGGTGVDWVILVGDSLGLMYERSLGFWSRKEAHLDKVAELEEAGIVRGKRVFLPQPGTILECATKDQLLIG